MSSFRSRSRPRSRSNEYGRSCATTVQDEPPGRLLRGQPREMRRDIKRELRGTGDFTEERLDELAHQIVDVARRRSGS